MLFSLSHCISGSLLLQQVNYSVTNMNSLNLERFHPHCSSVHKEDLRINGMRVRTPGRSWVHHTPLRTLDVPLDRDIDLHISTMNLTGVSNSLEMYSQHCFYEKLSVMFEITNLQIYL